MSDTADTPYYCIKQPRCGLCNFRFADGEQVVAAVQNHDVSCEFPFQRHTTFRDERLNIAVHVCLRGSCMSRTKSTVCFHSHCHKFRFFPVTPAFLAATSYAFAPSAAEERRRTFYIRGALAYKLQKAALGPRGLPLELWLMVAGHLLQMSAIVTAQELVHESDHVGDSVLDTTKPVFASYIKIDGRYYVKDLRNATDAEANAKKGAQPLLTVPLAREASERQKSGVHDLFVAEDHLGIRQVFFVSPEYCKTWCRNHPGLPGAWWKHIPVSREEIPFTVVTRSDGLKMREIRTMKEGPLSDSSRIGWQLPIASSPAVVDLLTLGRPREYPDGLRMRFFDCNTADITGYSVATSGASVFAILSHKKDEEAAATLYEDFDSIPGLHHWIYLPINSGEYLTDICRRAGFLIIQFGIAGITFTTNQGRSIVFGLYGHENVDFRHIDTLPRGPCRIFYNQLDSLTDLRSVKFVAFEKDGPSSTAITNQDALPTLPVSISDCPYTLSNEVWLHSSCTLIDVTEASLCINRKAPHRPVIGMLLCYGDGHRECVGQFRLDWVAEEPIAVGNTDKLYICGKRTDRSWAYVATVTTRAPADRANGHWLNVAQEGILEWWFSSRHSVLYHAGTRLN